ncbi:MAG: SDR family NAD(P)-dependent oxidoreductase [Oscillospiraceae bacterium]|jgi:NAD(P)-dependent dehydrogenase (short-subunit alcohol dehydrogenase family)|nr:SDR family NAD(P)-dependent oxidoreductase [Oscillospiraceae bacterium]
MDRAVAVTGAGRGLGLSVVRRHVERGDRIYAYEVNITDDLRGCTREYEKLHICRCDISSTPGVEAAVADMLAKEEQIHFLYNIAGVFRFEDRCGLADTDIDAGMVMMQVNAVGLLRMCKAVIPKLGAGSVVVNVTSESGSIGDCYREVEYMYGMSKAAANMASMLLQNEVKKRGTRVICVHPGWLRTVMGGEGAAASPYSVSPDESAANIVKIAEEIDKLPENVYFIEHTGKPLPW